MKTAGGQYGDPPHWDRKPPKGIFRTGYSAPTEDHYLDPDGHWIPREGFGPYRKNMEEEGDEQFRLCQASVLRLYDYDLISVERDGDELIIRARSK